MVLACDQYGGVGGDGGGGVGRLVPQNSIWTWAIPFQFHHNLDSCQFFFEIFFSFSNFRSFSSILNYVRRHLLMKLMAGFLFLLLLFRVMKPNYFSYGISYAKIIIELVNTDTQRQMNVTRQEAQVLTNALYRKKTAFDHQNLIFFCSSWQASCYIKHYLQCCNG